MRMPAPQGLVSLAAAAVRSRVAGAAVAQVWQACTSFALQVLAAHLLGAGGLGELALVLGVIVTTTAVTSGVVGDSLTVLDRHDPRVRGGLQWWALLLTCLTSAVAAGVLVGTGLLEVKGGVVFFAASVLFQCEELLRRVFMATMRFWHLVIIDSAALVVSVGSVAVLASTGGVTLVSFLVGVTLGQAAGCVVAISLLPHNERVFVSMRGAAVREVAGFGLWRGAQVSINPALMTGMRGLVILAAGSAALGEIEAARIFVAPTILIVQGLGSYLLASYIRDKQSSLAVLTSRATRAALGMSGSTLLVGVLAAAAVPIAGRFVTGSSFSVHAVTVLGWATYAAAVATFQPFASLAAARGRQRAVFAVGVIDTVLVIGGLVLALVVFDVPAGLTPFMLALGPALGGVQIRRFILRPMLAEHCETSPSGSTRSPMRAG